MELLILAIIWSWHGFWMLLLTYAIGRAAYRHSGWPIFKPLSCQHSAHECHFWHFIKWPIAGRWLMTFLCLSISLMIVDVARVTWQIYAVDYPTTIGWSNVIIRALPLVIEPWTFARQWRYGLINEELARKRERIVYV